MVVSLIGYLLGFSIQGNKVSLSLFFLPFVYFAFFLCGLEVETEVMFFLGGCCVCMLD